MKVLFEQSNYPVLQSGVYETYEQVMLCPCGNIRLIQDLKTDLIFNESFKPELIKYYVNYNNEQSFSLVFQNYLKEVKKIPNN